MIYEDYDDLVEDVSKAMRTKKKKKRIPKPNPDDDSVGGKLPLDDVLPPAHGHQVGPRVPINTNQKSIGSHWFEDIESRLCRLLEAVQGPGDQSSGSQKELQRGKVGVAGVEGHTKAEEEPRTTAAARRQAVDPYASAGLIKRQNKKDKDTKSKDADQEMQDTLDKMDQTNEIETTPSTREQM